MLKVTVIDSDGQQHEYGVTKPPEPGRDGTLVVSAGNSGAVWAAGSWQRMEWQAEDK